MREDEAQWHRCLLWHGWLPMLSGVNGALPWADLFFSASLILLLMVLVSFQILLELTRNSERPGFPTFCRSGQRDTSLEEFNLEVDGWLPLLPEVALLRLTGQVLVDVAQRKGATAGSLDGWE